jgi:hypothetical protein
MAKKRAIKLRLPTSKLPNSTRRINSLPLRLSSGKWAFNLQHDVSLLKLTFCSSELQKEVQGIAKGTAEGTDELSFEQRAEKLNHFYLDKVIPFYREVINKSIQAQLDEQLFDHQAREMLSRNQKADLIRKKFEIITREYDQQNKQFEMKHMQVKEEEEKRREEIVANFDSHLKTIQEQIQLEEGKSD